MEKKFQQKVFLQTYVLYLVNMLMKIQFAVEMNSKKLKTFYVFFLGVNKKINRSFFSFMSPTVVFSLDVFDI